MRLSEATTASLRLVRREALAVFSYTKDMSMDNSLNTMTASTSSKPVTPNSNAISVGTVVGVPVANATILPSDAYIGPDYTQGLTGVNLLMDETVVSYLWLSICIVLSSVLLLRLWQLVNAHIRHIYCIQASKVQQRYWSFNRSSYWPWLKRELIYAPLGNKRHNREIQLSSAVNYGTLPGRLHAALLLGYVATNIAYCLLLPYGKVEKPRLIAELRGRTGMLATVNMIPLVILAGRNNPVISLLKISFDSFNLFHRWVGRLVILESIVHVAAWYSNEKSEKGTVAVAESLRQGPFYQFGLVAVIAMIIILFQTLSAVRHAFYETFLHLHQVLACLSVLGVYIHLEVANLPALPYIRAVVGLWLADRILRLARLMRLNINLRQRAYTHVQVEALEGDACRVTFYLPNHITIRPGSHVYVYIPRISLWQSHPFSVAWTDVTSEPPTGHMESDTTSVISVEPGDLEKQSFELEYSPSKLPTSVSLIVAARTGMTRKLYDQAKAALPRVFVTAGFVEGPYAGHDSLSSYGTVVMFAGGAGITHHLIQIRHLIACAQAGTVATKKITLVWTVRDLAALSWVGPWMDEILSMPGRKGMLNIYLYVTRPTKSADFRSPSQTIELIPKRCDPGKVLDRIIPDRIGATMVTVCGPGAFADEVRAAVRHRLELGVIDMNEESFTW